MITITQARRGPGGMHAIRGRVLKQAECLVAIRSLAFNMVRTHPGKPGKSWNLKILNARSGKSWKNTKKIS